MIFFCHVQRTAGTTIHRYFREYFAGRWFIVSGSGELPMVSEAVSRIPDREFYLGGHIGLHDLQTKLLPSLESDVVFTTTRDPLERAVSLYFCMRRSPEWFGLPPNGAIEGFERFYELMRESGDYFHNDHCRLISGSQRFDHSVESIAKNFHIVGTSSRMSVLEAALVKLCTPVVPGFRITPCRENVAYHEETAPDKWRTRAEIRDIVGPGMIERIVRDHEQDLMLLDFIQRTHDGLFVNDALISARTRIANSAG